MKALLIVAAVILSAVLSQTTPSPIACSQYTDCPTCVSHHFCGWCSEPVVYPDNRTGTQCAGFDPNGTLPFSCNGIYSTDQCVQGYICDLATFQCVLGPPGSGSTLQDCEANCTNKGQVYLCNITTKQCYEVPRGTPGASSLEVCMASCTHPSPHPASPSPPAQTYLCNTTDGKCYPTDPGKGSSLDVCEENCKKSNGTQYICNTFLEQCQVLPPGVPGESLAQCEAQCNPSPNPGPPSNLLGVWRGVEIQNGLAQGEWDFNITQTGATIIDIASATTIRGIPFNRGGQIWINITAGPGAGQYWKGISQSAKRGPETYYYTVAFGAPGGPAPSSITDAMKGGDFKVFFIAKCAGTPECVFTMPASMGTHRAAASPSSHSIRVAADPCSQYSSSCAECLSHPFCGWCSTDVVYKDGQKGTQCAGFSQQENVTNPFICNGRYSTFNCSQGYDCNYNTSQCIPDPVPGNGVPLDVCQELCRPTPPPSPPPKQYVCNITSKTCYKCNQTYCPGSMPLATCEAACVKPKPGPSGLVAGLWRGLQIQNSYPLNEWQWAFNSSLLSVYFMSKLQWTGVVTSLGGDLMLVDVKTGPIAGKRLSIIYTVQNQDDPIYEIGTFGVGQPDGPAPGSYADPMQTQGEYELVMVKCTGTLCQFPQP